jgi:hypothetical protein
MNDLHRLHDAANESLARRLSSQMRAMRGVFGHIGAPLKTAAGGHVVSTDAPGLFDEGPDIGGGESEGVKA